MGSTKGAGRHLSVRAAIILTLTASTAAIATAPIPAAAQAGAARSFAIDAAPLPQALVAFGYQAGFQVVADAGLTAGRRGQAVAGNLAPAEALSRLLAGTGLTFRFLGEKTVQIERAPDATGAMRLGAVRVSANQSGGYAPPVDPVRSEGSKSYAPVAVAVGKSAQTLREIPQSVTVMTQQRLADQALLNLDEVMLQITGVTRDQAWLSSTYTSRGLTIENVRYDSGATSDYLAGTGNADTALFDSVALLRGADGLFGAGEAGGVINLQHKRPQADPKLSYTLYGGSWKNVRGEVDATGGLGFGGRLRGRVVAVFEDKDNFVDYKGSKRYVAYGAIEADLTPSTLLFVGASLQDDRLDAFNASLSRFSDGSDPDFPRSKNMGAPWNRIDRENTAVFGRIEQRIGERWSARLNLRYNRNRDTTNAAEMENAADPNTGVGTDWWYYQQDQLNRQFTADLNVQGGFDLFGQRHDVMIGADMVNTDRSTDQLWTYYGPDNVFDPTFPPPIDLPSVWGYQDRTKIRRNGLYGSLRIRPVTNVSINLGGRYVFRDRTVSRNGLGTVTSQVDQKDVFIPYAGVTWDFTSVLTAYASYAEIYQSQADKRSGPRPGTPLDPVTGTNIEAGIKGAFADGKLTASIALYKVKKKGEYANDPAYPDTIWSSPCCYIRDGLLKSKGFEVELNGELLPGWQISFGYTYNSNRNVQESDTRFASITPKHLVKIWTDYRFRGALEGLRIGGGVTGQSSNFRMGSIREYNPASGQWDGPWVDYRFSVKGYTVWAGRIGYDFSDRVSIGVNINNIFDKKYFGTINSAGYGNFYGDPRNVLATLKVGF